MCEPNGPNAPTAMTWRTGVFALLLVALLAFSSGCRPKSGAADAAVRVDLVFAHPPPTTGNNDFTLSLADDRGNAIAATQLEVEGDMNHAGMKPSFARVQETAPGRYTGTIEFTMGGDWILLVSGDLPDHSRFRQKVNVPGVATP